MERVQTLARWVTETDKIAFFTGAGISTESGIPDFRSPGGIWDQFDPDELTYDRFITDENARKKYWQFYNQSWKVFREASPNNAHRALAEMESHTCVTAVITQNIDGLHQQAGSTEEKVLELHGTLWDVNCMSCNRSFDWETIHERIENGEDVPRCRKCEGLLKPATVAFGEALPQSIFNRAQIAAAESDLFIAIGSSLVVYPAAFLPEIALESGSRMVIINRDPTPMDSSAHLTIHGLAGQVLTETIQNIR